MRETIQQMGCVFYYQSNIYYQSNSNARKDEIVKLWYND